MRIVRIESIFLLQISEGRTELDKKRLYIYIAVFLILIY